jgi:hypothetical protein
MRRLAASRRVRTSALNNESARPVPPAGLRNTATRRGRGPSAAAMRASHSLASASDSQRRQCGSGHRVASLTEQQPVRWSGRAGGELRVSRRGGRCALTGGGARLHERVVRDVQRGPARPCS